MSGPRHAIWASPTPSKAKSPPWSIITENRAQCQRSVRLMLRVRNDQLRRLQAAVRGVDPHDPVVGTDGQVRWAQDFAREPVRNQNAHCLAEVLVSTTTVPRAGSVPSLRNRKRSSADSPAPRGALSSRAERTRGGTVARVASRIRPISSSGITPHPKSLRRRLRAEGQHPEGPRPRIPDRCRLGCPSR